MFANVISHLTSRFATPKKAAPRRVTTRRLTIENLEGRRVLSAVSAFTMTGFPAAFIAGTPQQFVLTAIDASKLVVPGYAGTVQFTTNDAKASAPANYTFTTLDAGKHTFAVTFKTAGSETLTVTDPALGVTKSFTVVVTAAAMKQFAITGLPSPFQAGTVHAMTATAVDAYGNTVTKYTGKVHATSSDLAAILPADYTFTSGDLGTHAFNVTLNTPGTSRSVSVTDVAVNPILTGTQKVAVTKAASKLVGFSVTQPVGTPPVVAGISTKITVGAKDQYGNIFKTYVGTVHFTSTDPLAVMPVDAVFAAANSGRRTVSVKFRTAAQTVIVTDTVNKTVIGTFTTTVAPGVVTKFSVTGLTMPYPHGATQSVVVTALDAYGNVATDYTGTVAFASNDKIATLPSSYTFVAADHGKHTFSVTLNTAGLDYVSVADTVTTTIKGKQLVLVS